MNAAQQPSISGVEYRRRLETVRKEAIDGGFDALLAYSHSPRPGHVLYLTGYVPFNGSGLFVVTPDSCQLLIDADWDLAAAEAATWLERDQVRATSEYAREVDQLLGSRSTRIGILGLDLLPASVYKSLTESSTARTYDDATRLLDRMRSVKSAEEIVLLREAGRITSAGSRAFSAGVDAGVSELELALAVEAAMKRAGSGRFTFPTSLGSGLRTVFVAATPTAKRITEGEVVLLDCGGTYQGYCGDQSRTAVVGEPSNEQRRLLETVLQMYQECIPLLRPGVPVAEMHRTASQLAEEEGFEYAYSLTGHSLGCESHESPVIEADAVATFEENMVVAVEPGLHVEGVGGARIEDVFLIAEDGPEALTTGPLQLWE